MGGSNKLLDKEMKMPILFDTRPGKKEAYKFGCEGAHKLGINVCHVLCTNITIKKSISSLKF